MPRPEFYPRLDAMRASDNEAERVVNAIWRDVTDRRGWRQAAGEFDDDVKHEILDTWLRIVRDGKTTRPILV